MSSHRVAALPRSLRSSADRPDGGGVLEGIRERGIRCPQDVSVTGFDDV
ncbi:substrate-binding domain-containing protein, partial [Microbacterium sp.]